MKKAAIIITVILSSITNIIISPILFLLGALQSAYFSGMMGTTVHATLVLIGISLAVTAIPALIFSIIGAVKRKGVTDLILLAITLFIALALVCSGIAFEVVLGIFNGNINEYEILEDIVFTIGRVIGIVTALFLIIAPVLRMILTKNRALQYRVELHKPMYGVVLLVVVVCCALADVLYRTSGIVIVVMSGVLLVFAIVHLIIGLAGLSKAVKAANQRELQEAQQVQDTKEARKTQIATKEPLDLPFNLPAGVNPDDL